MRRLIQSNLVLKSQLWKLETLPADFDRASTSFTRKYLRKISCSIVCHREKSYFECLIVNQKIERFIFLLSTDLILSLLLLVLIRPLVKNPLGLLLLVFVTALRCILFICSFFGTVYGLITFLIYVTGMLVLFSYILRIFPNFIVGTQGFVIIGLPCLYIYNSGIFFLDPPFIEQSIITTMVAGSNFPVFLLLVVVLLFSLVVVTALCFKGRRPLRSR